MCPPFWSTTHRRRRSCWNGSHYHSASLIRASANGDVASNQNGGRWTCQIHVSLTVCTAKPLLLQTCVEVREMEYLWLKYFWSTHDFLCKLGPAACNRRVDRRGALYSMLTISLIKSATCLLLLVTTERIYKIKRFLVRISYIKQVTWCLFYRNTLDGAIYQHIWYRLIVIKVSSNLYLNVTNAHAIQCQWTCQYRNNN